MICIVEVILQQSHAERLSWKHCRRAGDSPMRLAKGDYFDSSVLTEYYVCVSHLLLTNLFINFLLSAVMQHLNFAARAVDLAAHPLITSVLD
jgi:hypothetical protein